MQVRDYIPIVSDILLIILMLLWIVAIPRMYQSQDRQRIARLERKIDLVLAHLGIEDRAHAAALSEVKRLAHSGQKIDAIKMYREATGVGLKEAKDAVEAMEHVP